MVLTSRSGHAATRAAVFGPPPARRLVATRARIIGPRRGHISTRARVAKRYQVRPSSHRWSEEDIDVMDDDLQSRDQLARSHNATFDDSDCETTSPISRASLLSLPEELIERICQVLDWSEEDTVIRASAALLNLSLTSKTLHRISQAHLYRQVDLGGHQIVRFTKSITENPSLATSVHVVTLRVCSYDDYEKEDVSYYSEHVRAEGTHDMQELESLIPEFPAKELFWVVALEVLLLKLKHVHSLFISWEDCPEIELFGRRLKDIKEPLLPALRNLVYKDNWGNLATLNTIFHRCKLRTLTAVGLHATQLEDLSMPALCPFLQKVTLVNSPWMWGRDISPIIERCPNLKEFHYFTHDLEDLDDEDGSPEDFITPTDIINGLESVKNTLESLSITTESLGDDDGFPSLRGFTALEHLRLDAFDLAEYESDDEEETDSDESVDEIISNIVHAQFPPDPATHPDAATSSTSDTDTDSTDLDDDEETETSSSSSSGSSSSSDTCKPFLHLLPSTLKTLWIDNLCDLEGDLDDELIKLAHTAKEDFPAFEKLTVEADGTNAVKDVQAAYKKAGIEFVLMPYGHGWYVEEDLGQFT
ncbi:hypothetical protein LTR64_005560 [Lithohypha guttulata]|uniref:uncharacterized protein n=1 Tax=Lithohypha guttulata TaxID=1690604 RepID=UPI002DDE170E|nr:hypothetical protein LTR51_002647 [Lithohypha guttulata]